MNPFPFSDDNKRYHTLAYHNLHIYGGRVYKATLDAHLPCPNNGGCVYCALARDPRTLSEQWNAEAARIRQKDANAKICTYFGVGTNTNCPPEGLSELLQTAQELGAFSASIATRADCLDEQKATLLAEFSLPLTGELGLQTIHDQTAELINRGHTFEDFLRGFDLLRNHNIRVCVHLINGLPNETPQMMLETARMLAKLRPDAVKIHSLHVLRGTRLYEMYQRGEITLLTREEYIDITARQLELLPPETVIERVTGDGDKALLAAPKWSADKIAVLGGLDKRLAEFDTFQGKLFID
ncbi:MAG: TIGR01212 family radical SAM protein [Oscillospiraceae bacterium]|nr:TIGR01212 family radical SAM protein [Oscillospiraceae bacterium]